MTTWDEMFAYRQELEKHPGALKAQQKILTMQHRHGMGPEGRRAASARISSTGARESYPKCALFGVTGGPGTDWRARFPTCGKFEERRAASPREAQIGAARSGGSPFERRRG